MQFSQKGTWKRGKCYNQFSAFLFEIKYVTKFARLQTLKFTWVHIAWKNNIGERLFFTSQ